MAWLRQAMQDPTQRPQIMQMIREAGLNATNDPTPSLTRPSNQTTLGFGSLPQASSTLSSVGSAMQKATPQTAGAAGIGAGLGIGLGTLLRRRQQANQQSAASPTYNDADLYQPGVGPVTGPAPDFSAPPTGVVGATPPTISDLNGALINLPTYRRGGRIKKFAEGGAEDVPEPEKKTPREVLRRKPMGLALPVLHTTIVIAAKPKSEKKAQKKQRGGPIKPIKPEAVPPQRGPQNGSRPRDPGAPFRRGGHVQVPRGSGRAIKGKRFSGIY